MKENSTKNFQMNLKKKTILLEEINMDNKKILVIGGTGSWGEVLVEKLMEQNIDEIRVFSRNESKLFHLTQKFGSGLIKGIVGDIRDRKRLIEACEGVDIIYHLAALKHVPICETAPYEAILTNVVGTKNVIEAANICNVDKVIYVSTDKAVDPNCSYGYTKALGEKLMYQADLNSEKTKFITLRSGNLLGSDGSVIPVFHKQMMTQGIVKLTSKKMNRFFIPIEEAADLLIEVARRGAGGEIFIAKMPSVCIYDLAKVILLANGKDESCIQEIGKRPGERNDELLVTQEEAEDIYTFNDNLYVILNKDKHAWISNGFVKKEENFIVNSKDGVVCEEEVRLMLEKNHLLYNKKVLVSNI